MRMRQASSLTVGFMLLLSGNTLLAEIVTATCYSPDGKRFDFVNGERQESADGYSNTQVTFFFTSQDPGVLIESWQVALPFPELMSRERADEIVPPNAIKATVLFRSASVIHAVSTQSWDAYTTTLYLEERIGIFSRVRVDRIREEGNLSQGPMGALFTAKCSIDVLE